MCVNTCCFFEKKRIFSIWLMVLLCAAVIPRRGEARSDNEQGWACVVLGTGAILSGFYYYELRLGDENISLYYENNQTSAWSVNLMGCLLIVGGLYLIFDPYSETREEHPWSNNIDSSGADLSEWMGDSSPNRTGFLGAGPPDSLGQWEFQRLIHLRTK
jgi:hypothetical protein